MAPISNSTSSGIPQGGQSLKDSFWNFELPISRRGHFFQDAAFASAYEQLNDNVRRILQRWGETDFLSGPEHLKLRPSDTLSRFRQLRRQNLKEEDQAVTVASDATSHKIVMDVQDFVGGEVKARVEGERELVVEGRTESKTGDWAASSSTFRRRFCLPPNTDLAAVTAVLSDDGILTVTAPLKGAPQVQGHVGVPLLKPDARSGITDARTSFASSLTADNTQEATCTCRLGQQARRSPRPAREHIIPIRVDEELQEASLGSTASDSSQAARESQSREFTCHAKSESSASGTCEASARQSRCAESPAASRASSVTSEASTRDKVQAQSSTRSRESRARSVPVNQLPITRRGLFFDDSFFASLHQDFESAVNDVLGRWGEGSVMTDDRDNASRLGRYRQLREHNLNVESQAVTATSDEASHKIVMDVHDFVGGEVKARVEGERELVVEGRTESKTGDWDVSSNSFRRRFCLPPDSDVAAVSAVLSDDGILTVTAPRLTKQHQSRETTIPIHTEDLHQTRQEHTTASTTLTSRGSSSAVRQDSSPATPMRQTSTIATQTDDLIDWSINSLKEKKEEARQETQKLQQSTQEKVRPSPDSVSLPITTRGLFFGDSFFKDSWQDFQAAVRDVVSKWGDPACPADDLTHYRSLRKRDLRDENQALRFTEDEATYRIVVDVQDFIDGGSVNVKSVQDRQLTVEGHVEQETGGERYKKHFHRRFVLPHDIYSESVSSVVSADGILTITAPKKPSTLPVRETIIPVAVEEGIHRTESLSRVSEEFLEAQREARAVHQHRQEESSSTTTETVKESSRQESVTNNLSSDSKKVASSREHFIPVVLEEEENQSMSREEERTVSADENTRTTRNEESLESSHAHADTTTATAWDSHRERRENIDAFRSHRAMSGNRTLEKIAESEYEDFDTATSTGTSCRSNTTLETLTGYTKETENQELVESDLKAASAASQRHSEEAVNHSSSRPSVKTVPISLKGDFFSDAFFEDARMQFTTAVQDVLQQTDATAAASDEVASYRSHLRSNPRLENQAAHVEEDTRCFKVVLDVHEFVGGELKVEVEDGKALVVEGQASCEEGASSSTLTFRRIFSLPSHVDVAAITSALSSDGVLTILTPKLQQEDASPAAPKSSVESHSRREEHSAVTEAWQGQQLKKKVTQSKTCYSEAYSSSSSSSNSCSSTSNSSSNNSSSSNSISNSCTQQQFSSNVL